MTGDAEFPVSGVFKFEENCGLNFKVIGDPALGPTTGPQVSAPQASHVTSPAPLPTFSDGGGWRFSQPWNSTFAGPSTSGYKGGLSLSLKRSPAMKSTIPYIKKTIPVVTLHVSETGQISVGSTVSTVYVKIPEDNMGVETLLMEAGKQLDPPVSASELCLLDSKFVPIYPSHAQTRGDQ